jgi:hypothetical protein
MMSSEHMLSREHMLSSEHTLLVSSLSVLWMTSPRATRAISLEVHKRQEHLSKYRKVAHNQHDSDLADPQSILISATCVPARGSFE